jgi:hypothetical protein
MRLLVCKLAPAVAAVLAMASGAMVVGAAGASATGDWGCAGSEVSGSPYPVRNSAGTIYSYVHLYWDGSTGKNCAVNVKTGSLYGPQTDTGLQLTECVEDTPTPQRTCNPLEQPGQDDNFRYYAGPVSVDGVGHCVVVQAWTDDTSGNEATLDVGPFHC